jgi:hypothetical protein
MAMGMMQQQQQPEAMDPVIPPVGDCTMNPALAGCAQAAGTPGNWETDSTAQTRGTAGDGSAGFSSLGDTSNLQPASMPDARGDNNNPITTHGVASGGGGGIPGAGGSGGATLNGGGGGQVGAGLAPSTSPKVTITEGGRSGYSQVAAGMNMQSGDSSGGYTYGAGSDNGGEGLHLADFLPGGKKDPSRNVAGVGQPSQIQPKSANLWNRISEQLRSRCARGLLRDCGPR